MVDPVVTSQAPSASIRHQRDDMNSARSRGMRSANREPRGDQWAEKTNYKMAEVTYNPYIASPRVGSPRRPITAPVRIDAADIGSLVSRLTRPNTSSARKAVLWSKPRKEYEFNYDVASNLKNPVLYWTQFPTLPQHYPGTWRTANSAELANIVLRLRKSTVASESRKDDCVSRRRLIEKIKEKAIMADIAYKIKLRNSEEPQDKGLPALVAAIRQEGVTSPPRTPAKETSKPCDEEEVSIPESAHQVRDTRD